MPTMMDRIIYRETAAMNKKDIRVERRYAFGKRKKGVYEARYGDYVCTAPSRKEAIAAVCADVEYVKTAGSLLGHECSLFAQGLREWVFVLPSGGSMCFCSDDLHSALARVASAYADHPDCQDFFGMHLAKE